MQIGVRAHDFGKLPLDTLVERIAGAGLRCVQLTLPAAIEGMEGAPGRLSPGLAWRIGSAFRRREVQIAVLSCYVNPIHPDPEVRAAGIELFKEHLRYARDFGCGMVATETGSLNTDFTFHPGNHTEASFATMIESVGEMVAEAERFGVLVGIEGVASFVARDPATIRRMLDAIDSNNLQILFDPVNLLSAANAPSQRQMVKESFELFADRIAVVHAKDFRVENGAIRSVPIGRGQLEYRWFFDLLKPRKPSINVIIEDTDPGTIAAEMRHLREVWAAAPS